MKTENPPTLSRELGRWDLTGLMINATIGAGILGLPGRVYALVGIWCVPLCLVGGVLAALVAASFAQAGSRFNRTGGAYLFAFEAFGPAAGFMVAWLTLVATLLSFAAIANLAVTYAGALWPALATPAGRFGALTVVIAALATLVYRGVHLSARAHNTFTLCKLALLLGFVAVSVPALTRHGVAVTALPPVRNIAPGLVLLVFALGGMEATVISGGEMRNPRRDIPFALGVGVLAIVALYSMVFIGSMALVPNLAASARPLFDGATVALGPQGGVTLVIGGTVSMLGVMFVILFSGPRVVFALSLRQQMPAMLARLHAKFHTPFIAVLAYAVVAWLLAVNFSFMGAVKIAVLFRLLLYASVAAATLRLRRLAYCETASPLELPCGGAIAWGALLICALIVSQSPATDLIGAFMALVPGLCLFLALQRRPRHAVMSPGDSG